MSSKSFYKRKKYAMDPSSKDSLLKELTEAVKETGLIRFAYIYGSFLREDSFGDIDLAIYLDESSLTGEGNLIHHETMIEMEMEERFNYPFDVRIINNAPLSFRYSVLKNGSLLYSENQDLSTNFASRTIVDYIDFLPYRRRYLKEVLGLEI